MNQYIESKQGDFEKAIDFFRSEVMSLRTGRANPNILENVQVDVYGTKTPLNGVASINVPDGQSIVISPWDKNIIKDVEKTLANAELGVGIVNEGEQIRLTVPKMTEENRKELVKKLNEMQEATRVTFRQLRDDIKQQIEKAEKGNEITEDDKFLFIKELDDEAKSRNEELKELRDKKEEEIMKI